MRMSLNRVARQHHRRSHVHQRKVPNVPVAHLFEIELRARPGGGNANRRQQVAGLQNVHAGDVDLGTDEIILGIHHALALGSLNHKLGVERDQGRRRIGRIHRHASFGMQNRMLAISAHRSVGIADVSAGAIARPTRAVVPAARVLRNVAAERALVANLRRRHQFRGLRQQSVFLFDDGMVHDFGQRRHGADFDSVVGSANAPQFFDSAQIDQRLGLLDSILEPIEAVEPARHHPGVPSVLLEKLLRVRDGARLKQLERRHDISYYRHGSLRFKSVDR